MKWLAVLFSIWFLQGCEGLSEKPSFIQLGKIPNHWYASGRMSAIFDGKNQNIGFSADFNQSYYQLNLSGALGFGSLQIRKDEHHLHIDNITTTFSFKQWMDARVGWHFPIEDLGRIVFLMTTNTPSFLNDDWQLKILSRHHNHLPKIIQLNHLNKDIAIKLVFKTITG